MKIVARIHLLESRTGPLIAPRKQATPQVKFLQVGVIEKLPKLAHAPMIQPYVVLVLGPVNHIEVSGNEPWARSDLTRLTQLRQEIILLLFSCWLVDHSERPDHSCHQLKDGGREGVGAVGNPEE
jgi:hypothetical protein